MTITPPGRPLDFTKTPYLKSVSVYCMLRRIGWSTESARLIASNANDRRISGKLARMLRPCNPRKGARQ